MNSSKEKRLNCGDVTQASFIHSLAWFTEGWEMREWQEAQALLRKFQKEV